MLKVGDEKELSPELVEKQKMKGTYDSPCLSVCNYEGVFHQCQTCFLRKAEKKLWKTGDEDMKSSILRAVRSRIKN